MDSQSQSVASVGVHSGARLGSVFLVIEDARFDDSSYVVAAYTTAKAAETKAYRCAVRDDGYSQYRVREVPVLGLPNDKDQATRGA